MNKGQSQLWHWRQLRRSMPKVVGSLLLILLAQQLAHGSMILSRLTVHDLGDDAPKAHRPHKDDESIIQGAGFSSQLYNSTEGFSVMKHTSETELPAWLKTYFRWHSNQLDLIENSTNDDLTRFRFLLLVCLKGMNCGGTADRLKAIPHFLIKANQTNRIFGIFWNNNNVTLSDYYIPPMGGLDWTVVC